MILPVQSTATTCRLLSTSWTRRNRHRRCSCLCRRRRRLLQRNSASPGANRRPPSQMLDDHCSSRSSVTRLTTTRRRQEPRSRRRLSTGDRRTVVVSRWTTAMADVDLVDRVPEHFSAARCRCRPADVERRRPACRSRAAYSDCVSSSSSCSSLPSFCCRTISPIVTVARRQSGLLRAISSRTPAVR